jgi:hypothetical protein
MLINLTEEQAVSAAEALELRTSALEAHLNALQIMAHVTRREETHWRTELANGKAALFEIKRRLDEHRGYPPTTEMEITDEAGNIDLCEVEINTTRVVRVIRRMHSAPDQPEAESQLSKHCDAGWMNDARFGEPSDY